MRSRPSPWRWLVTFPPAAGMILSAVLLAWPAAASAHVVQVSRSPAVTSAQVNLDAAIWHERVTDHAQRVQARRLAALERRLARERAARRAARLAAASAAARRAHAPEPAPQPAPAAVPPPQAGNYSFGQLEALWVSAGGPAWAEAHAAEIAICESGGRPDAYNPSGATGLWQILGSVVPGNLYDPMVNAENAVAKFKASGDTFAQWVCQ